MTSLWFAPLETPAPTETDTDGTPLSIDGTGITEWQKLAEGK